MRWFCFSVLLVFYLGFAECSIVVGGVEPLLLTPLIEAGQLEEARLRADVVFEGGFRPAKVKSYAGFLTVNKEYNSNLFFWYVEAVENVTSAPVVIYTSGWNASSLFGLFNVNGHLYADGHKKLYARQYSFHKFCHIVYVDHAVGRGFSFTEREEGYRKNEDEIGSDMYNALIQFFRLFPRLGAKRVYLGGASYGARAAVSLAHRIHNSGDGIDLKGIFLSAPWIDPLIQFRFGKFLNSVGLLGRGEEFDREEMEVRELISKGEYKLAGLKLAKIMGGHESLLKRTTGFHLSTNYLLDRRYDQSWEFWVQMPQLQEMLNVGTRNLSDGAIASSHLIEDVARSVKPKLEELLRAGYRIFVSGGQVDLICNHPGLVLLLESLKWRGKEGFYNATRKILKDEYVPGAYLTTHENLIYAVYMAADHTPEIDHPKRVFTLVRNFVNEVSVDKWSFD